MGFSLFRRERASGTFARDRLGSLRKALDEAGIDYSPANPLAALTQLPLSDAPTAVQPVPSQPFDSPLSWPAKTAIFTPIFRPVPDVATPDLLVMPLNAALELTLGSAGTASAVVVVTSVADAPLADHHRDLLWRSLGLPVFEQLTAWDGTVIARECEIHDGLHVAPEAIAEVEAGELILTQLKADGAVLRARTGFGAEITSALCECGKQTPRLRSLSVKASRSKAKPKAKRAHAA
jgi:hypothetical protein